MNELLEALAREAGKTLAPPEVRALVEEARAHLEEDIQARLEMGLDRRAAEREAIQTFGQVRAVAEDLKRREPRAGLAFLMGAGGMALLFGTLLNVSMGMVLGALSLVVFSGLFAAILWGSFHARRPQWVSVVALFVLTMGVSSLVASFTKSTAQGIAYRRSELPHRLADVRGWAKSYRRDLARYDDDEAHFDRGEPTSMPGIVPRPNDPNFDRWARAAMADRRVRLFRAMEANRREEASLLVAIDRPWWRQLPYAPATVSGEIWPSFATLLTVHLFAWSFGAAWRADRRRRRQPPKSAV